MSSGCASESAMEYCRPDAAAATDMCRLPADAQDSEHACPYAIEHRPLPRLMMQTKAT